VFDYIHFPVFTHTTGMTPFEVKVLKERQKERKNSQEGEEEDVRSYWMTLRKGEDTGN